MVSDQYRLVLRRRRVVADVVSVEASKCQRRVQCQVRDQQTRLLRRHVHEQLQQQTPTNAWFPSLERFSYAVQRNRTALQGFSIRQKRRM